MMKKKSIGTGTAVLLTAAVLYGCAGNSIPAGTEHSAEAQETSASEAAETLGAEDAAETLAVIEDEVVPLYQKPAGSDVRTPVASGSVTYGNGRATIDASNTSNGYVMIKYTGGQSRIKIQIAKSTTYTYDLNARDAYEVFPFTEGNGTYSIKIFENVRGNQYAQVMSQDILYRSVWRINSRRS